MRITAEKYGNYTTDLEFFEFILEQVTNDNFNKVDEIIVNLMLDNEWSDFYIIFNDGKFINSRRKDVALLIQRVFSQLQNYCIAYQQEDRSFDQY